MYTAGLKVAWDVETPARQLHTINQNVATFWIRDVFCGSQPKHDSLPDSVPKLNPIFDLIKEDNKLINNKILLAGRCGRGWGWGRVLHDGRAELRAPALRPHGAAQVRSCFPYILCSTEQVLLSLPFVCTEQVILTCAPAFPVFCLVLHGSC